jgi:hypothetical protein
MIPLSLRTRGKRIERRLSLGLLQAAASVFAFAALRRLRRQLGALEQALHKESPLPARPFADGERDLVDECSWESFPASDPPAFNAR